MKRALPEGVFFLDPDNRSYLLGSRPWYYVGTGPATAGCSLIILFVVPALGVAVLWYMISTKLEWRSFRQKGVPVTARIVDLNSAVGHDADGDPVESYKLTYAFEVPEGGGGKRYQRQLALREGDFNRLRGQETVDVLYRPNDPSFSRLRSEIPSTDWTQADLAGGLGCGALPILVAVLALLTERGRRQRLADGRILRGEVVKCTGAYDDDKDFRVELTCRFRTPGGREVEVTRRAQRNDLSPARLPAPGTPVLVRHARSPRGTPAVFHRFNDLASEVL
jgi:hypothetical protein